MRVSVLGPPQSSLVCIGYHSTQVKSCYCLHVAKLLVITFAIGLMKKEGIINS